MLSALAWLLSDIMYELKHGHITTHFNATYVYLVLIVLQSSQQPFMLPPFASLAEAESRNDVNAHAYENMPAVVESQSVKCKSPPKVS